MNIRWNIILSFIAIILLAWFYSLNQHNQADQTLLKSTASPEYIGKAMYTTVYSPTGKKQYLARAEAVEHHLNEGKTYFEMPELYLYQLDQTSPQQSWKVRADRAILSKNDVLYLAGNVEIKSLLNSRKLQQIETESAVINLKNQDISSEYQVKINGYNFHSTGLKLSGNLQQQVATLKEQVKTYYEIKK